MSPPFTGSSASTDRYGCDGKQVGASHILCGNRQVPGLLEQSPEFRRRSEAHGSIRVQEGTPLHARTPSGLANSPMRTAAAAP